MTIYKGIILSLLFVFPCSNSWAQNYANYTEKDGLASNQVYRITQDHEGLIWLITDKGISKFDGTSFKNYTREDGLPINTIIRSRITDDNRFWYFSRSYEMGYIKNDSLYHFTSNDNISMRPDQGINMSKNDLSFLGSEHNYRFNDTIWQAGDDYKDSYKLLNRNICYRSNENGSYLVNFFGENVFKFEDTLSVKKAYQVNDSIFGLFTNKQFHLVNLNTNKVSSGDYVSPKNTANITIDFHWVNDQLQFVVGHFLYGFDKNLEVQYTQNSPENLKSTFTFKDKDGFTWCATNGNGVYKLPRNFKNFKGFFNGKPISRISKIKNDIYVGVKEEGVYRLKENTSTLIVDEPNYLYSIDEINGTTFYGFGSHFITDRKGRLKTKENKTDYYAAGMIKYKDNYYTEGCSMVHKISENLSKVNNFTGYSYYQGLFLNGDLMFTFNYKDLLYYNDLEEKFLPFKGQHLGRKLLTHETINQSTFIGTEGDGLFIFKEGKLLKLVEDDLAVITSIGIENEDSIWAVSEGALLHYYKDHQERYLVKEYQHLQGYPTNNVNAVCVDDKQLYLGAINGLTVINLEEVIDTFDFDIYIKNSYLNGQKQRKDSIAYTYNADAAMHINFWSKDYYNIQQTTYQYRLEPIQNKWIATQSGEVNLFDLHPGNYNLQLKASSGGIQKVRSLPITIHPKWWQTLAFKILALLILGMVLFYILWWVIKYERAKRENKLIREKQLAQIQLKALRSQMNPHFVFNSLAAIQYYINENDFTASENYLVKFSRLIRTFFELSKETEITIDNEVALLVNYLDVEKLRFRDKFDYIIDVDPNLDKWKNKIPTMLLQPIVENAINHGVFNKEDKGLIVIKFRKLAQDRLKVSVADDGVGFQNTRKFEAVIRTKSSNVLKDRLYYLNKSRFWRIEYRREEAFPLQNNKGNISTFSIKKLA